MKKVEYNKFTDTLGISMVFVLFLQYALGMYTALYIEIPEDVSGWQFMGNSIFIMLHVILGTLLAGILLALMTGSAFMNGQSSDNSFLMSLGLGISTLSYAAGIYFSSVTRKISQ